MYIGCDLVELINPLDIFESCIHVVVVLWYKKLEKNVKLNDKQLLPLW